MTRSTYRIAFPFGLFLCCASLLSAQVQVSKEPHHKNVLENKFIRLLDVWINPGDTSLFHIHSTPSLFLMLTNTAAGSQVMGQAWEKGMNEKGTTWYNSFRSDTLIHRVANLDTARFHVIDIELLSPYQPDRAADPLPFTVLFENERAIAYKLTHASLKKEVISNRGPMLAQLVDGREVIYYDVAKKKKTRISAGKYCYIAPASSFYFIAKENESVDMVLFEIK